MHEVARRLALKNRQDVVGLQGVRAALVGRRWPRRALPRHGHRYRGGDCSVQGATVAETLKGVWNDDAMKRQGELWQMKTLTRAWLLEVSSTPLRTMPRMLSWVMMTTTTLGMREI